MLSFAQVLRHRLFHFAVIGGVLFAFAPAVERPDRVQLSEAGLRALQVAQAKKLGRSVLAEPEAKEVDTRAIEDEVLYKEALRMGLDRDDPIIRERLIQKLLLLVEDMGGASKEPKEAELRAYHSAHSARYAHAVRFHLVHAYSASRSALPEASTLDTREHVLARGQAFPYPREQALDRVELARLFGEPFAKSVEALATNELSQPLSSTFGWHRVLLLGKEAGRPATFDEARGDVTLDFLLERRERVVGTYLARTVGRYDIVIDGQRQEGFAPTRRVAVRQEGSAED